MGTVDLKIRTFKQEGDLAHEYQALRNMVNEDNEIVEFNTTELNIDLNNPLNLECQPSYDGTINLIINDDKNPPRIINSRFSKIEDNKYKIINRNQLQQTNLYKVGKIDQQTRLFRNLNKIPKIDLINVYNMGQLKGGNYTFYVKFADNDYNKTDIVAESGQVSVFKGYLNKPSSISGTIAEELTDKSVTLKISNIDTSFSKIYLYYIRETCDENGVRITKAAMISKPYDITGPFENITINGYEDIEEISPEEVNVQYNLVTAVKTQTQVQNMLFFGNVQGVSVNIKDLQNISYYINVSLCQNQAGTGNSIGWIKPEDYTILDNASVDATEYYNPLNIYYKLGYWPDEIYRLGIVYIMNDDSLSPVFNLRGCSFESIGSTNITDKYNQLFSVDPNDPNSVKMNYLDRDTFLTDCKYLDNTFGVFKNPAAEIIKYKNSNNDLDPEVLPLYYKITFNREVVETLLNPSNNYNIKGFFIVRQKRIPTTLCQGFSVGVDASSYIPMLYTDNGYITEGFLTKGRLLSSTFTDHIKTVQTKQCSGLLSVDAITNPILQSNFDGTEFVLKPTKIASSNNAVGSIKSKSRHYWIDSYSGVINEDKQINSSVVFVDSEVPLKYINGRSYSTKCGAAEDVSQFSFFGNNNYDADNDKLLRGIYCPFLGIGTSLQNNAIYDIKVPNYSTVKLKDYFYIRGKDTSPFFAVSQRFEFLDILKTINGAESETADINVFSGDCYSNTVTIRMNRNFIDSDAPISEIILDPNTWKNNYKGYMNTVNGELTDDDDKEKKGSFVSMNRADINTVNLGMWVTYKCLSSSNLGLRSDDKSYSDELALMGSSRSFYPLNDMSANVSNKVEESRLLNAGYSATVGFKKYFAAQNVPYIKELFDSRVMFSNVQREDSFQNAYRIFQALSFKDIDRQYGAIVKFIPWDVNILCIFEHGIGIIPINEKALIQTSTGQSIHMYGAGVLQNQISLISPDFGSIWPESIIRTPKGVYGVDTYAKKIWRVTTNGLENISDMKIQQFLNDNIKLSEREKYPTISLKNVKSHYNNYKGDVLFTFYNEAKDTIWNLCFNERMDRWITRYSWTPLYSENINNIFYSLDQKRASVLGYIYNNKHCTYGVHTSENEWVITNNNNFDTVLTTEGYTLAGSYQYKINSIHTSYLNDIDEEVEVTITDSDIIDSLFIINNDNHLIGNYQNIYQYFDTLNTPIPAYFKLNITVLMEISDGIKNPDFDDVIGIVVDNRQLRNSNETLYNKQRNAFLKNGFYVHGRAGIFNEIKYDDASFDNQILPTKWYEKQEPFEFEFVVNDVVGLHKIFDNLVIISNNVQPSEIEYEISGDVYNFNKAGIFRNNKFEEDIWNKNRQSTKPGVIIPKQPNEKTSEVNPTDWPTSTFKGDLDRPRTRNPKKYKSTQDLINCEVRWDNTLNSYTIVMKQPCKNIEEFGRRLGNIQYKEDSWYITIDPIMFRERFKTDDAEEQEFTGPIKSARVRDKFVKIRVKYTGEDIVIITALKTMLTLSYA